MLERLFHWLFGYVEFTVRGGAPRLFTMAAKNGLLLWDFAWEGETARARIKAREYRRLPPLCRRSGASARLEKKRGLPFFTARLARRKGLLAGAVLGAALFVRFPGPWGRFFLFRVIHGLAAAGLAALLGRVWPLPQGSRAVFAQAGNTGLAFGGLSTTAAGGLSLVLLCAAFLLLAGKAGEKEDCAPERDVV